MEKEDKIENEKEDQRRGVGGHTNEGVMKGLLQEKEC